MAKSNLDDRKFNMKICLEKCPFRSGDYRNGYYCDLYCETIVGELYDYDNQRDGKPRTKKCLNNIQPDSNLQLLKLVKENNTMLKELLHK